MSLELPGHACGPRGCTTTVSRSGMVKKNLWAPLFIAKPSREETTMVDKRDDLGTTARDDGPSADKLRDEIVRRLADIDSRNALLALDTVVSLLEPPYDSDLGVEAFLGVAEIIAGQRLFAEAARRRAPAEAGGEPD